MDNNRLIDTSDSPLEREILRAAADETVPSDVRRHALASLGLLVIAPPVAVASVGASAQATTSVVGKSLWWQAWLPKAGLLLGLGGTAVGGAVAWERATVDSLTVSAGAPPAQGSVLTGQSSPLAVGTVTMTAPEASSLPASDQAAATPPDRAPKAKPAVPARRLPAFTPRESTPPTVSIAEAKRTASIRGEIDLLDRARAELRRGAPDAAMTAIREYFARYPAGEFSAEAELVRRDAQRALSAL